MVALKPSFSRRHGAVLLSLLLLSWEDSFVLSVYAPDHAPGAIARIEDPMVSYQSVEKVKQIEDMVNALGSTFQPRRANQGTSGESQVHQSSQRQLDKITPQPAKSPTKDTSSKTASPTQKKDDPPADPCDGLQSCEECKEAAGKDSAFSDGETCLWRGEKCEKVTKDDKTPSTEGMCNSPPDDPCKSAESCEACLEASTKNLADDTEICFWGDGKCAKEKKDSRPSLDKMCEAPDPCKKADSCETCKEASNKLTSDDEICFWSSDKCNKETKEGHPPVDTMCAPQPPTDPCKSADSCEACAAIGFASETEMCSWDDEKCTKEAKEGKPSVEKMCEAAAPVDPCTMAETCGECKDASDQNKNDGKICYWSEGSCSKSTTENHPDADNMCNPPGPSDPCKAAVACEDCKSASTEITGEGEICFWENDTCSKSLAAKHPSPANMCDLPQSDPCESVATCDECKSASKKITAAGEICFWDGSQCTKGKENEHSKADKMCEPPPPSDPCGPAGTCEDCKDATSNITGEDQICFWDDGKCTKTSKEKHSSPENMCEPAVDPCKSAATCQGCKDTSAESKTDEDICYWSDSKCAKSTKSQYPTWESMCDPPTTSPPDEKPVPSDGNQGSVSSTMVIFFIVFVGVAYYFFRKRRAGAIGHHGQHSAGATRYHKSAQYEGIATKEKDETDDWDWDDDNGDVELATSANSGQTRYQDQRMPNTGFRREDDVLVRRTPSDDGCEPIGALPGKVLPKTASGSRGTPQAHSIGASPRKPRLSKLGSPKTKLTALKNPVQAPPPPMEDDIFAELGLSAKPTFGATRPVAATSGATTASRSLGATHLPPDDEEDNMASETDEWGDDADLDDLLND